MDQYREGNEKINHKKAMESKEFLNSILKRQTDLPENSYRMNK